MAQIAQDLNRMFTQQERRNYGWTALKIAYKLVKKWSGLKTPTKKAIKMQLAGLPAIASAYRYRSRGESEIYEAPIPSKKGRPKKISTAGVYMPKSKRRYKKKCKKSLCKRVAVLESACETHQHDFSGTYASSAGGTLIPISEIA